MSAMSKAEREELQRIIGRREKVLKSSAKLRSAELLADFENQMGQQFRPVDDVVFEKACREVERVVAQANIAIAARCRELGIAAGFAPSVEFSWYKRGYDNDLAERRSELRRMAVTRIAAIEAKANVEIERSCLEAQTEIAIGALTSDVARAFIDRLPPIETLMPRLTFAEVAGEADPPIAEQLMTSGALRQKRWRERHRNGAVTSQRNGGDAVPEPAADIPEITDGTQAPSGRTVTP
jgi:hypothetical protein